MPPPVVTVPAGYLTASACDTNSTCVHFRDDIVVRLMSQHTPETFEKNGLGENQAMLYPTVSTPVIRWPFAGSPPGAQCQNN